MRLGRLVIVLSLLGSLWVYGQQSFSSYTGDCANAGISPGFESCSAWATCDGDQHSISMYMAASSGCSYPLNALLYATVWQQFGTWEIDGNAYTKGALSGIVTSQCLAYVTCASSWTMCESMGQQIPGSTATGPCL
jgi:hypothetical protein